MRIKVLTIFPDMVRAALGESIVGRALEKGLLTVECIDIRAYSQNKHKNTDDYPFGGGAGMVMLAQPIVDACEANAEAGQRRIYLSPRGRTLTQKVVEELAGEEELMLLCGHYEGVDQRLLDEYQVEEISIGDYVLTGGELPAMILTDAVARMLPGVLSEEACFTEESHYAGLLEYPQYTRPEVWRGRPVPPVLLSGHHGNIQQWRRAQSLAVTRRNRPDLWAQAELSKEDKKLLEKLDKTPE